MTYEITYAALFSAAMRRGYGRETAQNIAASIALAVADADVGVDRVALTHSDSSLMSNSPHWWSQSEAEGFVKEAGADPIAFGRALHGAQDFYAHEGLGYPGDPISPRVPVTNGHNEPHSRIALYLKKVEGIDISEHPRFDDRFREVNADWAKRGIAPAGLDPKNCPDYYDPTDPWDQQARADTLKYAHEFARLWLNKWEKLNEKAGKDR